MAAKDAASVCLAAALLTYAAAVQLQPEQAVRAAAAQGLVVNSTRKAKVGLAPSAIAGTWSVAYDNPNWAAGRRENVVIDCFGRLTNWVGTTSPMYFGAAEVSEKCPYGDQGLAGGIEYVIPAWNTAPTKYECGWLDASSDVIYHYHYVAGNGEVGTGAHGHSNNGFWGRMEGTRVSTTACPASLAMFMLAPEWDAIETYGFNPDGVDRISGLSWTLLLTNPVIMYPGTTTEVFDLNSGTLGTDTSTSFTLGSHYTECAWVDWVDNPTTTWLTLFRPSEDHTIIVQTSNMQLGTWTRYRGGFHGPGYVINTAEWNFLCIVVDADAASTAFYVSVGGDALAHVGTVDAYAGTGYKANHIGHPSQEPGYVYMIAHWESELSMQEMEQVMSETAPPMVTLAASPAPTASPTASPTTAAPTASPTASPTTAAPTTSPTASPTTAAPTAAPTASPTTAAPPASVEAVGDPHMSDVRGRTFDINAVGAMTLLLVPKNAVLGRNSTLLHVQAGTKRVGVCGSLYIQNLLIQGRWVELEGGYNISATNKDWARPTHPHHKWRTSVGPGVRLTVGYGMTDSGILYLNFHAYGLAKAKMPIGGLLGSEDDEAVAWAKEKPGECLSLRAGGNDRGRAAAAFEASEASASL